MVSAGFLLLRLNFLYWDMTTATQATDKKVAHWWTAPSILPVIAGQTLH